VGKIPRGNEFFRRDKIIDRLWNIIESRHHILLPAPRRFGKSGILYYMQDNPEYGWNVNTLMLQDANKPSDLISLILTELLKDDMAR